MEILMNFVYCVAIFFGIAAASFLLSRKNRALQIAAIPVGIAYYIMFYYFVWKPEYLKMADSAEGIGRIIAAIVSAMVFLVFALLIGAALAWMFVIWAVAFGKFKLYKVFILAVFGVACGMVSSFAPFAVAVTLLSVPIIARSRHGLKEKLTYQFAISAGALSSALPTVFLYRLLLEKEAFGLSSFLTALGSIIVVVLVGLLCLLLVRIWHDRLEKKASKEVQDVQSDKTTVDS